MSALKTNLAAVLLLASLAGCGQQLVEFADAKADGGTFFGIHSD